MTWETPLSGNGEIQNYKLYYMEKGQDTEQVQSPSLPVGCIMLGRAFFLLVRFYLNFLKAASVHLPDRLNPLA